MKKTVLCVFIAAAAAFLPGCAGGITESESSAEPQIETPPLSSSSSSSASGQISISDNASDYVEITSSDSGLGTVLCPVLNEKMLDAEQAKAANAAFKAAADELSVNIEEFKKEHPGATAADMGIYGNFCCAESSLGNNILSVALVCKRFVGDESPAVLAYNFDVSSGRQMTYSEAVSAAGFFEEDAEDSVRWYCKKCLETDYWKNILSEAYLSGSLPETDSTGKANISESLVSRALEMFAEDSDKSVYIDMTGEIFVAANIPSGIAGEDGEYKTRLVAVGRNNADIKRRNGARYNTFSPITPRGCIDAYSAAEAVIKNINFDFEPEFNAERVVSIDGEYAYEISVYADLGSHSAAVGRYAAGALSPKLWKQNNISDDWELSASRAEWLPNTYDAADKGAIAVVVKNPSLYERWAVNPADIVWEMSANGKDEPDCFMILAIHDGTRIKFMNEAYVTLDSGEYVLAYSAADEDERNIDITSIAGEGSFAFSSENFYDGNDILYILSGGSS